MMIYKQSRVAIARVVVLSGALVAFSGASFAQDADAWTNRIDAGGLAAELHNNAARVSGFKWETDPYSSQRSMQKEAQSIRRAPFAWGDESQSAPGYAVNETRTQPEMPTNFDWGTSSSPTVDGFKWIHRGKE